MQYSWNSNDKACTLDELEQAIEEARNGAVDMTKLPVFKHEATGLSFRVGAMARAEYEEWRKQIGLEDARHEAQGVATTSMPVNRDQSDKYLLLHAVFTEDGKTLSEKVVGYLLTGRNCGPSTHALCEAAAHENPPRREMTRVVHQMFAHDNLNLVLWRVLFECGLGKVLLDKLSPDATPEEKAWAKTQLAKAEACIPAISAYFNVVDAAKSFGITFQDAARQKAAEIESELEKN